MSHATRVRDAWWRIQSEHDLFNPPHQPEHSKNLLYGALAYPYNDIAPQHAEGIAMTTLELKLNLPDQLAKDAVRMGLTSPDSLQTLLREAVRNRRLAGLAEARKRIAAANIPPLTMEEIEAEIAADRTERRAQSTS